MKEGLQFVAPYRAPRGGEPRVEYRVAAAGWFRRDIVNFMNFAASNIHPRPMRRAV
jgi:hypothetical protein